MKLRRVVEHIKHQHWTAIVIDLAIVVLGVFIGMQASNWNQERSNDQQSAIFTARLKADLREEDWGYQFLIAYNGEVLANANQAVNALDGKAALSNAGIAAHDAHRRQRRYLRPDVEPGRQADARVAGISGVPA